MTDVNRSLFDATSRVYGQAVQGTLDTVKDNFVEEGVNQSVVDELKCTAKKPGHGDTRSRSQLTQTNRERERERERALSVYNKKQRERNDNTRTQTMSLNDTCVPLQRHTLACTCIYIHSWTSVHERDVTKWDGTT